MPSTEFEIVNANDDLIVIRHIATEHVFTYPVLTNQLGEHVLGNGSFVASDTATVRPEAIARRVWNHAQMRMLEAGKIDRLIVG